MYIEGRIVKVENCVANKKVWNGEKLNYEWKPVQTKKIFIKQLMTGYIYWAYIYDCKVSKKYPDVVRVDNMENFHSVRG